MSFINENNYRELVKLTLAERKQIKLQKMMTEGKMIEEFYHQYQVYHFQMQKQEKKLRKSYFLLSWKVLSSWRQIVLDINTLKIEQEKKEL